jgi:hypothetical protein
MQLVWSVIAAAGLPATEASDGAHTQVMLVVVMLEYHDDSNTNGNDDDNNGRPPLHMRALVHCAPVARVHLHDTP